MLCLPVLTMAQAITVPWQCGFEDAAENAQWVLNPQTPNANDQWVVGDATYSEGRHSLYISTSNGASAQYGPSPNVVIAYRVLKFSVGKYNISFDWKTLGDAKKSKLYVHLLPEPLMTSGLYYDGKKSCGLLDIVSDSKGTTSPSFSGKLLTDGVNSYPYLYGTKQWQNYSITDMGAAIDVSTNITSVNARYNWVLAFIWVNDNTDSTACALGACIDNIQIASANAKKPTDLKTEMRCEDSTLHISWKSNLYMHYIEYKEINEAQWKRIGPLSAVDDTIQTHDILMRQEGSFSIRVYGYNSPDGTGERSAYTTINNVVFWCPENHCINYIDLTSPDTECRYGNRDAWPKPDQIGVLDYGEENIDSRHTINWIADRYDPYTTGSRDAAGKVVAPLKTIPQGYLASVRLGNVRNGKECESITYNFVVDSFSQAILILKYAIVFEDPDVSTHPKNSQPLFNIVVLDSLDREIDPTCGKQDFVFDDASEWNNAGQKWIPDRVDISNEIYWKDWTSLGLDLRRYHGMSLKVRVTTADCGQSGHFGYGYFVLDCVSASLETDNCGINSEIEINAPEGFDYTWTDSKGNIKGHDRVLKADAGYEVYTCRACMKEAEGCCFELSTDLAPRYPAPQYTWTQTPENCRNFVQFVSQSHVLTRYANREEHTQEPCDQIIWEFTNKSGTSSTTPAHRPIVECDPKGDTIYVMLKAVLGGGKCDSVLLDTLYIPSIISRDSVLIKDICEGEPIIFAGQQCDTTGLYYDMQLNRAGCDSLTILDLRVHLKSGTTYVNDTVCSSDLPYVLNGLSYIYPGTYSQTLYNQWNCDSVVQLALQITEKLRVEVDNVPTLCADGKQLTIDYTVMQSRFDSLAIRFTSSTPQTVFYDQIIYDTLQTQVVYPYTDSILPNHYHVQLEFYQHHSCGNQIYDLDFDIRYRASIVEQKWNDVLAILNSRYNGGYTFTAYQWYKDGMPLTGETGPYLYQPLDITSEYSVLLTRPDGVSVQTCAFYPVTRSDVRPFPTLVGTSQRLPVRRSLTENDIVMVNIYTLLGQTYSSTPIEHGQGYIDTPALSGNYVLEFVDAVGNRKSQYLIVTE